MCFTAMAASMLVENLSVLEAGTHVYWKRRLGYSHHAIVESVDIESGKVHVIEYGSDKGGSGFGKGITVRRHMKSMT